MKKIALLIGILAVFLTGQAWALPPWLPPGCTVNGYVITYVSASKSWVCAAAGAPSYGTGVNDALVNAVNGTGGFLTYGNASVLQSPATGLSPAAGTPAATDTILQMFNKIVGNFNAAFGPGSDGNFGTWWSSQNTSAPTTYSSGKVGVAPTGNWLVGCYNGTCSILAKTSDIPAASTTTPSMDGSAAYGSGTTWARADHVHPSDTTKVSVTSNVNTYMGGGVTSVTETSEAATCNWANGSTCVVTAEANTTAWTLTMSNPVTGQVYRVYITQQTGGPVPLPTFSPTVTWIGTAPTLSGTNTKHDAWTCQYVGTTYFCASVGNNF